MAELPRLTHDRPSVERRIHAALAEARRKEPKGALVRLSSVGRCERWLWAGAHGIAEERQPNGRALLIFAHGHAIEAHVIAALRAAGYNVSQEQRELTAFAGQVAGHIDGAVELGEGLERHQVLLEVKSAKASRFEELAAVGYALWSPEYAAQLQAYMGFGGYDEALVVVYCKDTSELHVEGVYFDAAAFRLLREKITRVLIPNRLPERPPQAKSASCAYCKWCSRAGWCWGSLAGVTFDE